MYLFQGMMRQEALKAMSNIAFSTIGTLVAFDPVNFLGQVQLYPDDQATGNPALNTGWLPIQTPAIGIYLAPNVGDIVDVHFSEGSLQNGYISQRFYGLNAVPSVTPNPGEIYITQSSGGFVNLLDTGVVNIGPIINLGTVISGTWNGDIIGMQYGGTGANLTPSAGGIFYSTGSTGAILDGKGATGYVLMSGVTAPVWSPWTFPTSLTANDLLWVSATNTISSLPTADSGVLVTDVSGVPSISTTLPSGLSISGLTAGEAVVTDASNKLASLAYAVSPTASTLVQRNNFGDISAATLNGSALSIGATNTPNLAIFNNGSSNGSYIAFFANGKSTQVGTDGSAFANIQAGALVLSTDSTHNLPIYLSPGQSTSWGLKVASGGVVNTANSTLDSGAGNMIVGGSLRSVKNIQDDGSGNATFTGTTFEFGSNTSGSPATMYLIGSSATSSDEGHLWFYKTGTTPTANGDSLGEIAIFGVNSGGTAQRAARIMAVSTAPATTNAVQTELDFRFTDPSGVEQIPFTLNYQGFTLNGCPTTFTGSSTVNFNFTGPTNVTFPTSGVLATVGGTVSSVVGTTNRITVTTTSGVSTVDIASTYVGQSSLTTLGTITTGTWNASLIPMAFGGTNANLTATANNLVYSTASAMALLPTANNGVLITSNTGVPSISSTLPTAVQTNITELGTITVGVWNGTTIDSGHGGTGLGLPSPGYMLVGSATAGDWAFLTAPSDEQVLCTDALGGIIWSSSLPTFVQLNINSLGTITAGTWNGSIIDSTYGGTGVDNSGHTITIGGNLAFSGAFTFTGTLTGNTSVTFPTSGTLVNTAVTTLSSLVITESQVTNLTTDLNSKLNLSGGTMTGNLILNADPTIALGACTKQYADAISAGLDIKQACYAASTAALTVTYNNGTSGVGATLTNAGTQAVFSIDGLTPAVNSRILIKDQSSTFQNGIYTVTNVGSASTNWVLTRATDYDQTSEIQAGNLIVVDNGTTNGGTGWLQTATITTIGTSAITFSPFNLMQVGTGLSRSGNTISLSTPVSAANGGTGVSNGTNTITLGGSIVTANSFTTSGNFAVTQTYTGPTNVTFPTSGTLFSSSNGPLNAWSTFNTNGILTQTAANTFTSRTITGTTGFINVSNGNGVLGNPTITIDSTYAGQTSITTLGTISTGTWAGTVIGVTHGGTGLTSTTANQILYSSAANTIGGITVVNSAGLLTNGSGIPGWVAYTGSGAPVLATSPSLVTPLLGTPTSGILTNCSGLPLTTGVTGILPVANGGSGTSIPALVQGTNISISGSWPNQTINVINNPTFSGMVTASVGLTANAYSVINGSTGQADVFDITSTGATNNTVYQRWNSAGVERLSVGWDSVNGIGIFDRNNAGVTWLKQGGTTAGSVVSKNNTLDDGTTGAGSFAGLLTANAGLTVVGATNINNTGTANTAINTVGGTLTIGATSTFLGNGGSVAILGGASNSGNFSVLTSVSGTNSMTFGNDTGPTTFNTHGTININTSGSSAINIGTGTYTGPVTVGGNSINITANSTGDIAIGNGLNSVYLGSQGSVNSVVNIQPGTGSNSTNICATTGYSGTLTIGNTSIGGINFIGSGGTGINSTVPVSGYPFIGNVTAASSNVFTLLKVAGTSVVAYGWQTGIGIGIYDQLNGGYWWLSQGTGTKGYVASLNNVLDDGSGNITSKGNFTSTLNQTGAYTSFIARASRTSLNPVQSNDPLSVVNSEGYDGSAYQSASYIFSKVDGAVSPGIVPGRLEFWTTSTGGVANLNLEVRADRSVTTTYNTIDDGTSNASFVGKFTLTTASVASQVSNGALVLSNASLSIGRAGNSSVGAEINFGTSHTQRMICLYDGGTIGNQDQYQYYGLGVNPSTLYYSVSGTGASHKFYAGTSSSTSNLLFTIAGTGAITTANNTLDDSSGNTTVKTLTVQNGSPSAAKILVSKNSSGNLGYVPIWSSISPTGTVAEPTGTSTSSSFVNMGLGTTFKYTPSSTGNVWVHMRCNVQGSVTNGNDSVVGSYGSGGIPTNGNTSQLGTQGPITTFYIASPSHLYPWETTFVITGLTLSTQYWFDISLKAQGTANTVNIYNCEFRILEF